MLEVKELTVRKGGRTIVDRVSFSVGEGEWLMLVGPNGAGKSTIVSAISQGVPYTGQILLGGRDASCIVPYERARLMGVLTQLNSVSYSFTVEEVVSLGRYARSKGPLSGRSSDDGEMISRALKLTGMEELRGQNVLTLSGGELQRAFLAQIFAQDPQLLVLDEPANHLDLVYQKQVFALVKQWLSEPGRAVLSVVHDLSLALAYGTHALLLNRGRVSGLGPASETLTPEALRSVYDMDVYEWMRGLLEQWER
ncbi:MAG: ABC transporter ATP-binding protein [Oscillospiraceae bacterium]|jgi:iron complex transport system ATP-binding protein